MDKRNSGLANFSHVSKMRSKYKGKWKKYKRNHLCGCWDSSPGLYGHNVEFLPLNYSHFCLFCVKTLYKSKTNSFLETTNSYAFNTTSTSIVYPTNDEIFSFFGRNFMFQGSAKRKTGAKC